MRMSELPISRRKFGKNKIGMSTKTEIRNPVATSRSGRGREIEICFSCENGAGTRAVVGVLQNRGTGIVPSSARVGIALSKAEFDGRRSSVSFRACEQWLVSSFGTQDGTPQFLSGASDPLPCASH